MNKVKLPRLNSKLKVDKVVSGNVVLGTTAGLAKTINEDSLGFVKQKGAMRLCIADGHWGVQTADMITDFFIQEPNFPNSKEQAVTKVRKLEDNVFSIFGRENMDQTKDFTPEASFIAIEIKGDNLTIIGYGDCRLLVANKQKITFRLKTTSAWLGAFSHLGLRGRLPIAKALVFKKIKLFKGDSLILFTDGVDECIYEKPTISNEWIAGLTSIEPNKVFDLVLKEVFSCGGEDNATLAIVKI